MKDRVYLIDLGTGTDRSLVPLACGLISSYCRSIPEIESHYNFDIRMLGEGLDELLEEIKDPAVVGISCYVWNFLGDVELSRRLKERYPDVLIVWGGPSIPARQQRIQEFLGEYPWVDILVQGEGELTFADLLLKRLNGSRYDDCNGITYRTQNPTQPHVTTPPRDRIMDFAIIPSPFLNGTFDVLRDRYGDYIVGALWETSRGCPFKCTFCDWGSALVTKVNRLEIERVVKEIEWVSNNRIHYVYATDANFGISPERDLEIARRFVEVAQRNGFPDTLVLNWTKNSRRNVIHIADTLVKGGVTTNTTLSFQSFNPPTLKAIKRNNIKLDVYRELKEEYHSRKLPTYTELILGLPEETLDTFTDGLEKTLSTRLEDQLSIYPLVLLENTEMALPEDREKYKLETRTCAVGLNRRRFKYPRFGVDEIVVGTSTMPIPDWKRAYEIAFAVASLYNLRVAFFLMVYLKQAFGSRVVDFVKYILDTVDSAPEQFPALNQAISHVRNNCQLILDNISSVSAPEGASEVVLTPHEAMTFLLLNRMDEAYTELGQIAEAYLQQNERPFSEKVIQEVLSYQQARMPVFALPQSVYQFETNIPYYFECTLDGKKPPEIEESPTTLELKFKSHPYKTETEFNLRRVSGGYTLNVAEAIVRNGKYEKLDGAEIPPARNVNLSPF